MKKKSDPRQNIVLIIIIVLSVLVGITVVIEEKEKGHKRVPEAPRHEPGTHTERIVEYALPETIIKGCLLDLGIDRQDVLFQGNTVKVSTHRIPSQDKIIRAFKPVEEIGDVSLEREDHVQVVINKKSWDIFFSLMAEKGAARCAIIVDDMGLNLKPAKELAGIDTELTFAVLPNSPESRAVARFLHAKGSEILLHLPMQGNGKDPGPGAILEGMQPSAIKAVLKDDMRSIPYISGVSNHMGSLVTADQAVMRLIMKELKDDRFFFVDSLTTNKSVCRETAVEYKVPFIARDVFLDNELKPEAIASQVEKLVNISMKHSRALAICHPHPETIAVLQREIPRMKKLGIEIVRVSALMDSPGEAGKQ